MVSRCTLSSARAHTIAAMSLVAACNWLPSIPLRGEACPQSLLTYSWGQARPVPRLVKSFAVMPVRCRAAQGEDVSEVLFCYSLGAYKTQSNSQANRVIS